jgi:hypothetical protein
MLRKNRIVVLSCTLALVLLAVPERAEARGDRFAARVAGTYLVNEDQNFLRLLTLTADGNVFGIDSSEASGSSFFGDQQGVWSRTGRRAIAATLLNFRFVRSQPPEDGGVEPDGSAVGDYEIRFGPGFATVRGTITLHLFAPSIDPLAPDATPTGDPIVVPFEGRRVPAPRPERRR